MKYKKIFKTAFLGMLYYSGTAFLIEKLFSKQDQFLIIIYHRVADDGGDYSISKELFEKQIKFLKQNFNIISLSEIKNIKKLGGKKIIITFDDGYENNYLNVFPVIKKFKIPIHIFLIMNRINKKGHLSWKQIIEMKKSRLVFFGNHTLNHCLLSSLNDKDRKLEIKEANIELENRLGRIKHFSYPYGGWYDNEAIKILKEVKMEYGLTCFSGINDLNTNPYLLKRAYINDVSVQSRFKLKYPNLFFKIRGLTNED